MLFRSRRRMSRQMSSGQAVSGHLPSGRSACLTDAEFQGKYLPDDVRHGICLLDDACHGICLLDEKCQGICLLDAARVLYLQSVKANVIRTTHAMASAFQMKSVSAFGFLMQLVNANIVLTIRTTLFTTRTICQRIFLTDAVHMLQIRNVITNIIRTTCDTAYAYQRSVRAFGFWTQHISYGCRMSW